MQPPRIIPAARVLRADVSPPRRFFAGLTFGAAALSLILATALPARADKTGDDLAKALLGILVIGTLAHELGDKDRKSDRRKKPKPEVRRVPSVCAIEIEGERRNVTVYPESCLRDHGLNGPFPRNCGNDARIYGQWDRIYSGDCLREAGFQLRDRRGH